MKTSPWEVGITFENASILVFQRENFSLRNLRFILFYSIKLPLWCIVSGLCEFQCFSGFLLSISPFLLSRLFAFYSNLRLHLFPDHLIQSKLYYPVCCYSVRRETNLPQRLNSTNFCPNRTITPWKTASSLGCRNQYSKSGFIL